MVEVATGGIGTRAIRSEYPVTEGLIAGQTRLSEIASLEVQEEDLTTQDDREGI